MKKETTWLRRASVLLGVLLLVRAVLYLQLPPLGLMLRNRTGLILNLVTLLVLLFVLGGLIYKLNSYHDLNADRGRVEKALSTGGIIVLSVLACILGFFGFVFTAVGHQKEYVVERYGQVMVAQVHSYVEVTVEYYAYVNAFVCGDTRLGYEWYGSGGYDPLGLDEPAVPVTFWFCDGAGNLLDRLD